MGNSTAQPLQCFFSVNLAQADLTQTIVSCTAAFLGIVYACLGYRMFRYIMFITGFVSGGAAAYALCTIFGRNLLPLEAVVAIVLTSSIVVGCTGLLIEYVSLLLNGLYCGLIIGACTFTFMLVTPMFVQPTASLVLAVCVGLLSLCRCTVCAFTILATSVNGSFAIVIAADYFLANASLRRTLLVRLQSYYLATFGTSSNQQTTSVNETNSNWTVGELPSALQTALQNSTTSTSFWTAPFAVTFDTSCAVVLVMVGTVMLLTIAGCCIQQLITRRIFGGDDQTHEARLIYITCAFKRHNSFGDGDCESSSESASIVNVPIASVVDSKRQPLLLTVQPPTPELDRQPNSNNNSTGRNKSRNRGSQSDSKKGEGAHSQNTLIRAQKFRRLYRARRTGGDVISSECAASIREAVQLKNSITDLPKATANLSAAPVNGASHNGHNGSSQSATGSLPGGGHSHSHSAGGSRPTRHLSSSQSRDSLSNFGEHQAASISRNANTKNVQDGSLSGPRKATRSTEPDSGELPYTVFLNTRLQTQPQPQPQPQPLSPSQFNVTKADDSSPQAAPVEPVLMRQSSGSSAAEKRISQSIEVQTDDPNWLVQLASSFETRSTSNQESAPMSHHSGSSHLSAPAGSSQSSAQADLAPGSQRASSISPIWQKRDVKYAHRNRQQHASALQPLLESQVQVQTRDAAEMPLVSSFEPIRRIEAEPDLISGGLPLQASEPEQCSAFNQQESTREMMAVGGVGGSGPVFELETASTSALIAISRSKAAQDGNKSHKILDTAAVVAGNAQREGEGERRRDHEHGHHKHKHKHKHHSHAHGHHRHGHHSSDQQSDTSATTAIMQQPQQQQQPLGDDVTVPVVRTIEDYRREQRHRRRREREREQRRSDTNDDENADHDIL